MRIGVPKETRDGERRVALVPDAIRKLTVREGVEVVVESGAGEGANFLDEAYREAGAEVSDTDAAWGADVVCVVAPPSPDQAGRLRSGQVLIGHLEPLTNGELASALASAGVTSFAMEVIPRTTRAQAMDALSSQANLGGYAAVLVAAREVDRIFPMMTTAAGTLPPARVLVLGAGVAGLQAIATAKRLGAIVTGFDVRSVVREQVESLGARFLEIDVSGGEGEGGYARELEADQQEQIKQGVGEAAAGHDVVITTAQIPGRRAPILLTASAVEQMKPGSVIVDLAGASGGNCELTRAGETVVEHGVSIVSDLDLPSSLSANASTLYATNVANLLGLMVTEEGSLNVDFSDDILDGACIAHGGEIHHEGARAAAGEGAS